MNNFTLLLCVASVLLRTEHRYCSSYSDVEYKWNYLGTVPYPDGLQICWKYSTYNVISPHKNYEKI